MRINISRLLDKITLAHGEDLSTRFAPSTLKREENEKNGKKRREAVLNTAEFS